MHTHLVLSFYAPYVWLVRRNHISAVFSPTEQHKSWVPIVAAVFWVHMTLGMVAHCQQICNKENAHVFAGRYHFL